MSYQEGACVLQNNISCYSLNHNPPSSWLLKHGKNSAFKKKISKSKSLRMVKIFIIIEGTTSLSTKQMGLISTTED